MIYRPASGSLYLCAPLPENTRFFFSNLNPTTAGHHD
jgi:hypothetical protein